MTGNVHVTPVPGGWQVIVAGAPWPNCVTRTQAEAIRMGRDLALRWGVEFLLHGADGRIRQRESYGNDPFLPRDLC